MTMPEGKTEVVSATAADTQNPPIPLVADPTSTRPRSVVVLHWLTVACLIVAVVVILAREEIDGKSLRLWLLDVHRHFGLIVLALFFFRFALRMRLGRLPAAGDFSPMARFAATATHAALYLLLLIQPVLGWALSNAQGWPVRFLGVTLPTLVSSDEDLADKLTILHQGAAWLLLALVLLHASAALWHHYVRRDNVLRAMLPARRRSQISS